MKASLVIAVLALESLLLQVACSGRSSELPSVDGAPIASQAEILKRQQQKEADARSLAAERSTTNDQLNQLQDQIDKLSTELASNQKLTLEERKKLQDQLDEAQRQKQETEAKLKELQEKQKKTEQELAAAKTTASQQQSNTVTTTGTTQTNTTGTPVKTSSGQTTTPQQTASTSSGTTSTQTNTATSNPTTNATEKHLIFYNSDCLSIGDNSTTEGALVYAKPCSNSSSQQVTAETENGSYRFVFQNSQKCLYVQGASSSDGAALQQLTCRRNGDSSELFQFAEPQNTYDFKLKNVKSGLCLKINTDGKILQSNCATNYTLFRWRLTN